MEQYQYGSFEGEFDLAQFDEEFASAQVEEKDFDAIPDGKYQVNVDKVELTKSQTTGNPMLKWTLRIIAPTSKGRFLWRNNVIASKENIKWLKQDLFCCGLVLEKLSELPHCLERLLNVKLEVTKRTKGENENIYFNRRIQLEDDGFDGGFSQDQFPHF